MKIIAISGSLRAASLNTMLLRAISRIAPQDMDVLVFERLGELPLFNPDIEHQLHESVLDLKNQIISADAVIIASPEYAHGVTGVIKNALDWMVGNESFVFKPVALLNTSARATLAYEALKETLRVMSANMIESASITIPVLGSCTNEDDILSRPEMVSAIEALLQEIKQCAMVAVALPPKR